MSAFFDVSDNAATIIFDSDVNAPILGNWNSGTFTIHQNSRWYETGAAVSRPSPNRIVITAGVSHVVAGNAVIDYDAAMLTIVGQNGIPVASFTGFPCPPVP